MKTLCLIGLLCLLSALLVCAQSEILSRKVELEFTEGTIALILNEISNKGEFSFSHGQDIPLSKYVSLKYPKQTVQQFLSEILGNDIVCLEYRDKLIIMMKADPIAQYAIRGKIIDGQTSESIPGATVFIPGSEPMIGTASDQDGFFQLIIPSDRCFVRLSCVGYESKVIKLNDPEISTIELKPAKTVLNEVKIVQYAKPKQEYENGAISKITTKQLEQVSLRSIEASLQGMASGVHVVKNSGMPGSSLQINVRGINSLINSDPVYYLDGIPIQQSFLNAISPHDIESIDILKDASGTTKYGIAAGNGVVLLHSKKGSDDKTRVSFDFKMGIQQVWKTLDLMTTSEFLEYFNKVKPNGKRYNILDSIYRTDTDWMQQIFHKANTEDYHISLSRGNSRNNFYLSVGYYQQEAIIKSMKLSRYSFKVNSSHSLNSRIKIGQDISFAFLHYKGLKEACFLNDYSNPILGAMLMPPFISPLDTIYIPILGTELTNTDDFYFRSPNNNVELSNNSRRNYALLTNVNAQITILPNVEYVTRLGFATYYQDNISYSPTNLKPEENYTNLISGNKYNILDLSFYWNHALSYSAFLAPNHLLNANFCFEIGQHKNEWNPVSNKLYDESLNIIKDTTSVFDNKHYQTDFSSHAYSASLGYVYKKRYQINLLLRNDYVGFYRVRKLQKLTEIYPAISLGWIFTRERFIPKSVLNYGKIRLSWGQAGNSPQLNYSFYAKSMRDMEYIYAFDSGGLSTSSAMRRSTHEQFYLENMKSFNMGLDLGLFQDKLFLSVDYFNNTTNPVKNYPTNAPVKPYTDKLIHMFDFGIIPPPLAHISNKGFEGDISYKHAGQRLSWNVGFNFTHVNNKIIDVDETYLSNIKFEDNDIISIHLPGETAGSFYGYKIERLFNADDCDTNGFVVMQPFYIDNVISKYNQGKARAGDYMFKDVDGNNRIDKNDKMILGNPFPDLTFGIYMDLNYRFFDLSMLWQGTYGNEIFNATKLWLYNPYGFSNWTRDITNSYREPKETELGEMDAGNTNTSLHRYDYLGSNRNLRVSDFYVEDGSYIRLKNIQLGYTFNPEITTKAHIQKLRISVSAQNLLTFTHYSGLDPEVGGWGIDSGIYPQPRVYMLGVHVIF